MGLDSYEHFIRSFSQVGLCASHRYGSVRWRTDPDTRQAPSFRAGKNTADAEGVPCSYGSADKHPAQVQVSRCNDDCESIVKRPKAVVSRAQLHLAPFAFPHESSRTPLLCHGDIKLVG